MIYIERTSTIIYTHIYDPTRELPQLELYEELSQDLKSLINGFKERGSDRFTSLPIYLLSGDFICREGRSPSNRLPYSHLEAEEVATQIN